MIRGIIFDCFGVLCQGSLEYLMSQASPENRQKISDTNHASDYGYIDRQEYIVTMAELLGRDQAEIESIMQRFHMRNEPMITFAKSLQPAYKIGLLSNVGDGVIDKLFTDDELTHFFDAVVLSGQEGMAKPYPEIFELAASRLGLAPEECVMIDDIPRNVEGAQAVGMYGIVCSSVVQVQTELAVLLDGHHA